MYGEDGALLLLFEEDGDLERSGGGLVDEVDDAREVARGAPAHVHHLHQHAAEVHRLVEGLEAADRAQWLLVVDLVLEHEDGLRVDGGVCGRSGEGGVEHGFLNCVGRGGGRVQHNGYA